MPLRSLIPSLDSATLEVLARTESALGVTRIARLAGRGSRPGHERALARLAEHGLVEAVPTNKGHMYRLNREHLLIPALLAALSVRQELFRRLAEAVSALTPTPLHASVFGSFARGEGTEGSDIDLVVVMPEGYDEPESSWEGQLQELESRVLAWTGNQLEVLVLTPAQLEKAIAVGEPVLESLRREALTLLGLGGEDLLGAKAAS